MKVQGSAFSIFRGSEKDIVAHCILPFLNIIDAVNMIMVCKTWYNACLKQETYWTSQRKKVLDKLTSGIATNNYTTPESLYRLQSSTGLKLFFFETACLRQMSDIALFNWMATHENIWIVERLCSCFYELPYEDISCFQSAYRLSTMPCVIQKKRRVFSFTNTMVFGGWRYNMVCTTKTWSC